jgi:WD40 repeat protein
MMAFPCLRPQKSCVVTFQSYRQQALPQGFAGEVEMDGVYARTLAFFAVFFFGACASSSMLHCLLPSEADPNEYVFELSQSSGGASGASGGGSDSSGSTVAAALSNRGIGLFEGASLRALGELTGHTGTITDVAFNPANPHLLLSCAEDGSARGWDLRMKAQAAQFDHGGLVNRLVDGWVGGLVGGKGWLVWWMEKGG